MILRVAGHSHLLNAVPEGSALPNLDPELRPLCREPFRRIDRFIQLALLGSAKAVQGRELGDMAGLYVSTGVGPVGNNIAVQEMLIGQKLLPKPFQFVNTLGSSTGYYVCKNLGLRGQALFISRRHGAFLAALSAAAADLELGVVKQALVGVVEECTLPLSEHRRRQELPEGLELAEGSHWMLLEAASTGSGPSAAKASLEGRRLRGLDEFKPQGNWMAGMDLDQAGMMLPGAVDPRAASAFHDSLDAARMTEFLEAGKAGELSLLNGNEKAGYEHWVLRVS